MNTKLLTAAVAAFALAGATCLASEPVSPIGDNDSNQPEHKIAILAHRGYWNCEEAGYARNSVASLRCAQEAGFWGAEFDVHLTLDEKIIIIHDDEVDGKRIEDNLYSEFENYTLENGEKIPMLDDYLAQGAKNPKMLLVCEIKKHSTPEKEDRLLELVVEKMKEYGMYSPDRMAFVSFSRHVCDRIAATMPGFMVQYVDSNYSPDELSSTGIPGLSYQPRVFAEHPDWFGQARSHGMMINCWNINDHDTLVEMVNLGVDVISSDFPMLCRDVFAETGAKEL